MVSLLALGMLLRLIFLDSDPDYDKWLGFVVDEGRWTELARELVLFGSPDLDSGFSRLHLILAPAYQAITAVFFAALGVGFTSARLVSALSGIGLLIGAIMFLRERLSTEGLFVTGTRTCLTARPPVSEPRRDPRDRSDAVRVSSVRPPPVQAVFRQTSVRSGASERDGVGPEGNGRANRSDSCRNRAPRPSRR